MVRLLSLIACLVMLSGAAFAQDETLSLELVLDPRETPAFEGEMVLGTIRGVYRETIAREELKLRRMTDFDWIRLGQDHWRQELVDGRAARVMERRIAFYPKRSGRLEIPAIVHQLELVVPGGGRATRLLRSRPVGIEVRPRPVTGEAPWLPVRALEVSDHWSADPAVLEDGQLVERRVILRALGATPEMMPRQPPLREPWLITFSPPAQVNMDVTPEGPVTTVEWRWKLRPVTGEPGVIPEATIAYYDTTLGRSATAILPASPIGYASFANNARSGWTSGLGPAGLPLATGLIACLAGLAVSLGNGRLRADPGRVLLTGIRTRFLLLRLGYLLRRGRLTEYRREAALALRLCGVAPDVRETLLSSVDAAIFGGQDRPASRHLGEMHRAVREAVAGRSKMVLT
ncbi:hypothetical protein PVT71_27125 (plasmid) [Salipiger sp. H15]|uniref:Protein BatD n=1 Tax=Alloyangia sp. H15 TaxID=3029062 RepID=A0AAU8ARI2_9RHOB